MGVGTGVDAQFGSAVESVYGTIVAPTRYLEFDSETIKPEVGQILSRGLGRARTQRGAQVRTYVKAAAGDTSHDVMTAGFGIYLKHTLGAVATTGAADPYTHTVTPDAVGLKGLSQTVQIGRPSIDGTVQPFTYAGGKIVKLKLSAALDQALKMVLSWDFQTEATATALGTKSYAAGAQQLIFVDGSLSINSVTQFIKAADLEIDTGLNTNRRGIGNSKKEPLANGQLAIVGNFDFEFEALTRHAALTAGTLINTVQLNFMNGTHGLQISIPQMVYTPGGEPTVGGPDIVDEKMPWMAVDNGTNPIITAVYVTSDALP